ncbi:MAG: diheme cytochrome [Beijerinckiaceae bacterium]|nr:MAG: diheme cytochrome [Beijerinckiaceae bacterium]
MMFPERHSRNNIEPSSDFYLPAFFIAVLFAINLSPVPFMAVRAAEIPLAQRQSGFELMQAETQAMQRNDLSNPAMLWVREGEKLWDEKPGENGQSCVACHGVVTGMAGVAASYPTLDTASGRPIDLTGRIQQCRTDRQRASAWPRESRALLAMASLIGLQSRGMPIMPAPDPISKAGAARGKALFNQRVGQLNLSCAQCHDDNWGRKLGSATIPQGHPTGYPIYRLEWQGVGSLQRRLRNCLAGVRAEAFPFGADALIDLELFLMERAAGMTVETPAVRP